MTFYVLYRVKVVFTDDLRLSIRRIGMIKNRILNLNREFLRPKTIEFRHSCEVIKLDSFTTVFSLYCVNSLRS